MITQCSTILALFLLSTTVLAGDSPTALPFMPWQIDRLGKEQILRASAFDADMPPVDTSDFLLYRCDYRRDFLGLENGRWCVGDQVPD